MFPSAQGECFFTLYNTDEIWISEMSFLSVLDEQTCFLHVYGLPTAPLRPSVGYSWTEAVLVCQLMYD